MSQDDRDMLLEVVRMLELIIGHCPAEMRRAFHPLIDSAEFITRAMDRDEDWFSHLRVVDRRWLVLDEFIETVCGVNRAEYFVEEARRIVKAQGVLESCERLHREIAERLARGSSGRSTMA
jgi:hypothetical protein